MNRYSILGVSSGRVRFVASASSFSRNMRVLVSRCPGVQLLGLATNTSKDCSCCRKGGMFMPSCLLKKAMSAAKTKSAFYNDMLGCLLRRSISRLARRRLVRVLEVSGTTTCLIAAGGNTVHSVPGPSRIRGVIGDG